MDSRKLRAQLRTFDEKVDRGLTAAFDYQAARSEAHMKMTAPWSDRTTNARNGLYTATKHMRGHHEMLLSHSVHYGIHLETRFSGRYEVIRPSLLWTSIELKKILNNMLPRLGR